MDPDCPIIYSPGLVVARDLALERYKEFDKIEDTTLLFEIGSIKITKALIAVFPQFTKHVLSERMEDIEKEVIQKHLCSKFAALFLYSDLRDNLIMGIPENQMAGIFNDLFSHWEQGFSGELVPEPLTQINLTRQYRKLVFPWLYEKSITLGMIKKVKTLFSLFITSYFEIEDDIKRKIAVVALASKIEEIPRSYFERRTKSIFKGTYQAPAGESFLGGTWELVLEYSYLSFLLKETKKINHGQYISENMLQKELRKTNCTPNAFLNFSDGIRIDILAKAEINYEVNKSFRSQEDLDEQNIHALIPWKKSEKELRKLFDLLNTSGALRSTGYYTFKQHFLIYTMDNPEFGPVKRKILWTDKFPYYCLVQMVEALEANGYIGMSIFPGRGRVKYFSLIKYHFLNPFGKNFSDEALRQSVNKKSIDDDEEFLKKVLNAIGKGLLDQNS
jgi:hypothetical protein